MKEQRPELKKLIADVVRERLLHGNWSRLTNIPDVQSYSLHGQEGDLHTILKVVTNGGTRWYEITVKEKYT